MKLISSLRVQNRYQYENNVNLFSNMMSEKNQLVEYDLQLRVLLRKSVSTYTA